MSECDLVLPEPPAEQNAESVTPFAGRRKSVAGLVPALTLFVAAGTFTTLWVVERGDHQAITGQLRDAQAEFRQAQQDLTSTAGADEDLVAKTRKHEEDKVGLQAEADALRPRTEAVREFYRAGETRVADTVFQLVRARCR